MGRLGPVVLLAALASVAGCKDDAPWWEGLDVIALDEGDGSGADFEVVDDGDVRVDGGDAADVGDTGGDADVRSDADGGGGDVRTDADAGGDAEPCVDNGCGGCEPLPLLGGPCGPCSLDVLECDGTEALTCSGRTTCDGPPPAAPEWIDASDGAYVGFVRLSWPSLAGVSGYRIYRDGTWLASVDGATTTYDDATAPAGGAPRAVTNLVAESRTNGVTLYWDAAEAPAGRTLGYAVAAVGEGGEGDRSPTDIGSRGAAAVARYEVSVDGGAWLVPAPDSLATSLVLNDAWVSLPRIVAGTVTASTTDPTGIRLSAEGFRATEPLVRARVRAVSDAGEGPPSEEVQGQWLAESLNYAWSRAASALGPFGAPSWFGASAFDTSAVGQPAQYYELRVSSGLLPLLTMPPVMGLVPPPPGVPVVTATTDREDDVRVTWSVVSDALSYEIQIDGGAWQSVTGTSYTDTAAPAGTIRTCTPTASDGAFADRVALECAGAVARPGAARAYRVRSVGMFGSGAASAAANGQRAAGALRFSWERSAGDSASGFAAWTGGPTAATGSDTSAGFNDARHYRVTLTAGAAVSPLSTSSDRGYRGLRPTVATEAATVITMNGATLNGRVADLGGAPSTSDAGFCWRAGTSTSGCAGSTAASPCGSGFNRAALGGGAGVGTFAQVLTGAAGDTTHAYCAYAANALGVAHGVAQTFRTLPFVGCGDGTRGGTEQCDGSDLGGQDCASQGFVSGRLRCTAGCTFDTSGCSMSTTLPLGELCTSNDSCASGLCSLDAASTDHRRCVPAELPSAAGGAMEFRYVPATGSGGFTMGSPSGEVGYRGSDETQHNVVISRATFVGRTEVTQGQWKAATGGTNPSCFQSTSGTSCGSSNANNSGPVERVDWWSVAAYANWLSEQAGLTRCYTFTPSNWDRTVSNWSDGNGTNGTAATNVSFSGVSCTGYRLLTEAEWEWSARGGTTTATYGGDLQSPYDCELQPNLNGIAWYCGNSGNRTQAVGGKTANAYGLRDTLGNVWEWTTDWYVDPHPSGSDPVSPSGSGVRVRRGDGWSNSAGDCRAALRYRDTPDSRISFVGFRLSRSLP